MRQAVALKTFRRSDTGARVQRGQRIEGDPGYIADLARGGLVVETGAVAPAETRQRPPKADGESSSASPAVRVSRQAIANKSGAGGKRKKAAAS